MFFLSTPHKSAGMITLGQKNSLRDQVRTTTERKEIFGGVHCNQYYSSKINYFSTKIS